ncbi:MAG: LytTR family DNA-binding domain-containing protein [Ginsengibacter sp.]
MINCVAIDDEELALELLEDNIKKIPFLNLVAKFNNPIEAMNLIREEEIDLVFLDIQMPQLSGLQFIKSIQNKPMFILVTAYEKFALDGFELDVVDYLVKPVPLDRFIKACNKAQDIFELKKRPKVSSGYVNDYFFVNVDYSQLKIMKADIIYIEGLKDYVKIHLKSSANPVVTRLTMKSLEENLTTGFIRIHKSFIVSITAITAVRKNSVFLGSLELPVSENYLDELKHFTGQN